jgi:hypothetical protein
MKYYTIEEEGQYKIESRCVRYENDKTYYLMSRQQLKEAHSRRRFRNETSCWIMEETTRTEAIIEFESNLKKVYDSFTWKEENDNELEMKADSNAIDILQFIENNNSNKYNRLSKNVSIVYLLYKDDEVVYVGQSVNTSRPWQHTDKDWDSVDIKIVPPNISLDIIEAFYIRKYKPKYNRNNGNCTEQLWNMTLDQIKIIKKEHENKETAR